MVHSAQAGADCKAAVACCCPRHTKQQECRSSVCRGREQPQVKGPSGGGCEAAAVVVFFGVGFPLIFLFSAS